MDTTLLKVLAVIVICGVVVLFLKAGTFRFLILSILFVLVLIFILLMNNLVKVPDFLYFLG
jgi:hypothetical protein